MTPQEAEQRKEKITTIAKWGIGVGAAVLFSFVAVAAVKGAIGLALAAGIGLVTVNVAPVLSQKLATWRMKAILADAEQNPIENMQQIRIEQEKEVEEADRAITDFEAEIANYNDETAQFRKAYPEEAPAYEAIGENMRALLAQQKAAFEEKRADLDDLIQRIAKAQAIYKMSLAAERVTSFSKSAEKRVFLEIREKVAFDAVRAKLNKSSAALSSALRQRQTIRQLPPPSAVVTTGAMRATPELLPKKETP